VATDVKQQLLDKGMAMLLKQGYHDLGLAALLQSTHIPKGSFYHYFKSKEDFALQVLELYMQGAHQGLDLCLRDDSLPALRRVRHFFELSEQKYREEGYLGCLVGGLGQELSGVSEVFRRKVEQCFSQIEGRLAEGLELAIRRGELKRGTDAQKLAKLLMNCWEGAALRSRLLRDPAPLHEMLDFAFHAAEAS
jgi:TetR/AcrR family transcriptional repressor of nem operon